MSSVFFPGLDGPAGGTGPSGPIGATGPTGTPGADGPGIIAADLTAIPPGSIGFLVRFGNPGGNDQANFADALDDSVASCPVGVVSSQGPGMDRIATEGAWDIPMTTDGGAPVPGKPVYLALSTADGNTAVGKASAVPPDLSLNPGSVVLEIGHCQSNANYSINGTCVIVLQFGVRGRVS